jgi:hypothetical protein
MSILSIYSVDASPKWPFAFLFDPRKPVILAIMAMKIGALSRLVPGADGREGRLFPKVFSAKENLLKAIFALTPNF